jgi:hypothetical protein
MEMRVADRFVTALALLVLVSACDSSEQQSEPPAVEDTVFGDAIGTMDEARAVESTMMREKEERDRAIDAAEAQ